MLCWLGLLVGDSLFPFLLFGLLKRYRVDVAAAATGHSLFSGRPVARRIDYPLSFQWPHLCAQFSFCAHLGAICCNRTRRAVGRVRAGRRHI